MPENKRTFSYFFYFAMSVVASLSNINVWLFFSPGTNDKAGGAHYLLKFVHLLPTLRNKASV